MTPTGAGAEPAHAPAGTGKPDLVALIPGVAVAVVVAAAARATHALLPENMAAAVGEVIIAVGLGILDTNLLRLPSAVKQGVRFCVTTVLRIGIVLLGANLAIAQLVAIGGAALAIIVCLMVSALVISHLLAVLTRTPSKVATLVGVGVSVCGNTAIIATAPAIAATDDDVATAITVNTLFGTIALFAYPLIARALNLEALVFGTWAGTAVNDTSQVVAAGFAYGAVAGQLAVTIKLARNAMMGFVIVGMSYLHRRSQSSSVLQLLQSSFPLFVVGFVLMAVANSVGLLEAVGSAVGLDLASILATLARALLLVALAAVGLSASVEGMRHAGWRPFAVGFATATLISVLSLALISVFGPAGA